MTKITANSVAFTFEENGDCWAHIPMKPAHLHMQMIDAYIVTVTSLLEEAAAKGQDVSAQLPGMIELSKLSGKVSGRKYALSASKPDAPSRPKPEPECG